MMFVDSRSTNWWKLHSMNFGMVCFVTMQGSQKVQDNYIHHYIPVSIECMRGVDITDAD